MSIDEKPQMRANDDYACARTTKQFLFDTHLPDPDPLNLFENRQLYPASNTGPD
jgi:hypothetical protein